MVIPEILSIIPYIPNNTPSLLTLQHSFIHCVVTIHSHFKKGYKKKANVLAFFLHMYGFIKLVVGVGVHLGLSDFPCKAEVEHRTH